MSDDRRYTHEDMRRLFFRWRGVEEPCERCQGAGVYNYPSGSTWRGGMGTASYEWDVCDACWGSGDKHRYGVDLRKERDEERERIAARAAALFADRCGIPLRGMGPAIEAVCSELDRLARGRKERPQWFHLVCEQLAKTLREAMEARLK